MRAMRSLTHEARRYLEADHVDSGIGPVRYPGLAVSAPPGPTQMGVTRAPGGWPAHGLGWSVASGHDAAVDVPDRAGDPACCRG